MWTACLSNLQAVQDDDDQHTLYSALRDTFASLAHSLAAILPRIASTTMRALSRLQACDRQLPRLQQLADTSVAELESTKRALQETKHQVLELEERVLDERQRAHEEASAARTSAAQRVEELQAELHSAAAHAALLQAQQDNAEAEHARQVRVQHDPLHSHCACARALRTRKRHQYRNSPRRWQRSRLT